MSTTSTEGRPLRFAVLTRVSTERQEKQGESLRVQREHNDRNVELLGITAQYRGSHVVARYGDKAEHATAGYERAEVDRLIADAARDKFDAVMVTHHDRWSRDNAKSDEGIRAFKEHRIKFFVGVTEVDLFDPTQVMILDLFVLLGKFFVANQKKKAVLSRIHKARRGIPSVGEKPPGRSFNYDTETWEFKDKGTGRVYPVDPEYQAKITDIANRCVAGESVPKLADEYGMNHAHLCRVLNNLLGDAWTLTFDAPEFNIHEVVTLSVPPLLVTPDGRADHALIKRVRDKLVENRGGRSKSAVGKHGALLGGYVYCAGCKSKMTPQALPSSGKVLPNGKREYGRPLLYYRHKARSAMARAGLACPYKARRGVPARLLDPKVFRQLFDMFGSPATLERAVKSAVPDADKTRRHIKTLEARLEQVRAGRRRVLALVARGKATEAEADAQLDELKARESAVNEELSGLRESLADVPDAEQLRLWVETQPGGTMPDGRVYPPAIFVYDDDLNIHPGGSDFGTLLWLLDPENPRGRQDMRALVESTFGTRPMSDGRRPGVYVTQCAGEPRFTYELVGRLAWHVTPQPLPWTAQPRYMPVRAEGVLG